MLAGTIKAVWLKLAVLCCKEPSVNFPMPIKQLLCVVECESSSVDSQTRSDLSMNRTMFKDDLEGVFDSPESYLAHVCDAPVLLQALSTLIDVVKTKLYLVLPHAMVSVLIHFEGIIKSTDLTREHPYDVVTVPGKPDVPQSDIMLCNAMNNLSDADRKKVLGWALTVTSQTDVIVGKNMMETHTSGRSKGALQMIGTGRLVMQGDKRVQMRVDGTFPDAELPPDVMPAGMPTKSTGEDVGEVLGAEGVKATATVTVRRRKKGSVLHTDSSGNVVVDG